MSFEQARQYLARVIPWPQDGEPPAYVNIHWTFQPKDGLRPGQLLLPWSGRACRSLDEAMNTLAFAMKNPDTRDVYACLSTQRQAEEKLGKNNFKYFKAIRAQSNVVALKSLFLDIDFKGGDKGYDTKDEAVAELARFLRETQLPKPSMLVLSGGGIHVYWTMSRPLSLTEWQPLSYALAEATKRHALKCDTQCTVDGARVLRIPSTFNRKLDQPRPVTLAGDTQLDYSSEAFEKALAPYRVATPKGPGTLVGLGAEFGQISDKFKALQAENDLAAGVEAERPPVKLKDIAMECAFVRDAILTGGAAYTNPEWNLTTLLATFTEDGRANAHRMGCKHPGYTKESTDAEYDRKEREKTQKGLGWPSCVAISATGCKACQSCKHFPAGKTPVHATLGKRADPNKVVSGGGPMAPLLVPGVVTSAVTTNDLPPGYIRDAVDGRIMKIDQVDDGNGNALQELTPICEYSMEDPWIQQPPGILHFHSRVERGRKKAIEIPLEIVNTMEMRKHLQSQSLMLPAGVKGTENVSRFLVSWIRQLQETRDSVTTTSMGWSHTGPTLDGFVFGGRMWTPAGDKQSAAGDNVISRQYQPTGHEKPWVDAAKMITDQKRPALEALLASSFGAPLVAFSSEPGVLLSAYSKESGIGKSTVLKIAQAVWGDPITSVQSLSDTNNSVMNKLGQVKSLPLYWDEIKTEEQTKKFVEITFQTTQGKEKSRMSRDIKQREPGRWQTLLVSASNDSLLDYVTKHTSTTTAGLYRVFQFVVPPAIRGGLGQLVPSDAGLMVQKLNHNHGCIGLRYAGYLGQHHAQIATDMADLLRALQAETSSTPEERFWLVAIAAVLLGARYSNHLGFTAMDEASLKVFMLDALSRMRKEMSRQIVDMAKSVNLSTVLSQYLGAMRARHTLYTNKCHNGQGKPVAGSITVNLSMTEFSRIEHIFVQAGEDDEVMRLARVPFIAWLREKGYSPDVIIREMMDQWGVVDKQGRLGSGTKYRSGAEVLFQIDLARVPQLNPFKE